MQVSDRKLIVTTRFQHARLIIVFLTGRQCIVAEDIGCDPHMLGIMDGDARGRTIPEQVRGDGLAEGLFRMQLDLTAYRIAGQIATEP